MMTSVIHLENKDIIKHAKIALDSNTMPKNKGSYHNI